MIVAGIDLSLARTGIAVVRSPERVETATVVSKPPKAGTETLRSRYERMETIAADVLGATAGRGWAASEARATGRMGEGRGRKGGRTGGVAGACKRMKMEETDRRH